MEEIEEQGELESELDDDEYTYNLYSPVAYNFPEKVENKSNINTNQVYGLIPSLDLSKTNNENYKFNKKEIKHGKTLRITKKLNNLSNEEWVVALKHAGLSIDELIRLSSNKFLSKVFEAMINLNRIIQEKNYLLQNSLIKLKSAIVEKQKKEVENIDLYKKLINMRSELENLLDNNNNSKMNNTFKYEQSESSMIVNDNNDNKDNTELSLVNSVLYNNQNSNEKSFENDNDSNSSLK